MYCVNINIREPRARFERNTYVYIQQLVRSAHDITNIYIYTYTPVYKSGANREAPFFFRRDHDLPRNRVCEKRTVNEHDNNNNNSESFVEEPRTRENESENHIRKKNIYIRTSLSRIRFFFPITVTYVLIIDDFFFQIKKLNEGSQQSCLQKKNGPVCKVSSIAFSLFTFDIIIYRPIYSYVTFESY